ncbi:MAG: chemical-damaging agent resistance protein C [Methylococcaceae bacterium]|nr:chemical-damaging agent resistance protein C [Methylococcaceae bacterium]
MGVSLNKGGRLSLSKENPGLKKIQVGLGWDERATDGATYDLDASAFILSSGEKVRGDEDFIFYNNLKGAKGAVEHMGDNLTGGGEGDDEVIKLDLAALAANHPDIEKISMVVTIHDAEGKGQNFGQVENAFIRVVNDDTNVEIVRFDLTEDYSIETAMIFGEIYIKTGEWRFSAVGQGFAGGLAAACSRYGINAG